MSAATASPGQENTPVPESVFHLPGEYWRIAANHQILLNKIIASVQKQKHVKMEVVGLHWVEGATFEASDRSPYDTKGKRYPDYPADKVTFFDTKQWNLPSDLRQTGFLYLVTCDGEYLPKTSYEYEKRLIVVLRPLEK